MTPARWTQIKAILNEARTRRGAERRGWLEKACGGDPDLLADVESFLAHEHQLTGFIEEPVLSLLAGGDLDRFEPGRRIGPYRLESKIGEGGMGAVFRARRDEDFEQTVALKLIRPGLADPAMVRRFEAERQILAKLEHPNIARLLDGGADGDGNPYFAMELVEGVPIVQYCDQHRLRVRRRLELFLEVCSALQVAHQNLVIHRDLKPSNILVDPGGHPKLLDFGIAKVLSSDGGGTEGTTVTMGQAMTLRYASPEQLQGGPVGTASDLYSLGVVLYQALTGRLPAGLEARSGLDLMEAICHRDPVPPSVVVGRSEDVPSRDGGVQRLTPDSLSAARSTDPKRLKASLSGDVDSIVMKALRKAPGDRYSSIEQFAEDLRRHLAGLPVTARQGNVTYLAGKFVRRNRLALGALALIGLLAVGFTAALVLQLRQTERARARAERVSSFLIDLFQAADPNRPAGAETTVRQLLDRGRRQLEEGLEGQPEVRATLSLKLGEVYVKLGDYAEAKALLEDASRLYRRVHDGDHPDIAATLNNLAVAHYSTGDLPAAERLYRSSIDMRLRLGLGEDTLKPMNNLAAILMQRGDLDGAEGIYRRSLERRRETLGPRHPNVAVSLRSLAMVRLAKGDLDGAEPLLQESLDLRLEAYGPQSPKVAMVLLALGRLEHARGRLEDAEVLYADALRIRRSALGETHLHTALAKKELAGLLLDRGDLEAPRILLRQALAALYPLLPEGDAKIAEAEGLLGQVWAATGRPEEGAACLAEALRTLKQNRGPDAAETLSMERRLEAVEHGLGAFAGAHPG